MAKSELPKRRIIAFVVDDEQGSLTALADDLRRFPEVKEVHTFTSYAEATFPLLELQPDVVFLDIETPGKSGIDFLRSIRTRISFSFHAVFYTAHSRYMIDAIRQSAFDFLQKPYKTEELREILERIVSTPVEPPVHIASLSANLAVSSRKLALQTISEMLLVAVSEVLLLQYDRRLRAWMLTLTDGSVHRLHTGLSATDLLAMSPTTFVRISSSSIVNLTYLAAIENTTQRCRLCQPFSHIELFASRRYFSKLKERFELL